MKEVGLLLVVPRENELTRVADAINNDYCATLIIPSDITKRENVEHELLIKQYFEVNNQVFLTID